MPVRVLKVWLVGAVVVLTALLGIVVGPLHPADGEDVCTLGVYPVQEINGSEPLGIDREGNILWRVSGDGHLSLIHPDGTEVSVNPYPDRPWYSGQSILKADGRVIGAVWSVGAGGDYRGYVWDGQPHILRGNGAYQAWATNANHKGTIVGTGRVSTTLDPLRAVIWRSLTSRIRFLAPVPGFTNATAQAVDRHNLVRGDAWNTDHSDFVNVVWRHGIPKVRSYPEAFRPSLYAVAGPYTGGYITHTDGSTEPAIHGPDGVQVFTIPAGASGTVTHVTAHGRFAGEVTTELGDSTNFSGRYGGSLKDVPISGGLVALYDFGSGTALYSDGTSENIARATCLDGA